MMLPTTLTRFVLLLSFKTHTLINRLQLQRMVSDRASLEKKIAKELNSFAKKWEGRMIKVNPFPQGSYQAVTMAGPHQARAAASTHLAVATKLHDGTAYNPALPPIAMA